jgi:3-methyladenine DNA glycosylase AlkD
MRSDLKKVATKERAEKEKQYLKSELEHIGVNMPSMRKIAKAALSSRGTIEHDELWALVDALWTHRVHELRAAAIEMLIAKPKLLVAEDLERVNMLIRESKTWAFVDPLAISVTGGLVARFEACRDAMDDWSRDDDFWVRRAAMLSLLRPLRRGGGDFDRFSTYADAMLEEKEFFIRKAIGWILRETSKKRPQLVRDWIEPRIARASGVTVREAVKYLPEKDELMAQYRATH